MRPVGQQHVATVAQVFGSLCDLESHQVPQPLAHHSSIQQPLGEAAEVIKDLLAKGAVVESLDLKEAPDILSQALRMAKPIRQGPSRGKGDERITGLNETQNYLVYIPYTNIHGSFWCFHSCPTKTYR